MTSVHIDGPPAGDRAGRQDNYDSTSIPAQAADSQPGVYGPSPIKRKRRTKSQIEALLTATRGILAEEEGRRITLRHLFYRLTGLGAIDKTENHYKALGRHAVKWRRAGEIPYDAFADSTRYVRGARTYSGVASFLEQTVDCYRKNLWQQQDTHIQVWCEKDAIGGVLGDEAARFGVDIFICRGFSSLTALADAAVEFNALRAAGKKIVVAYFGDHDPSGQEIGVSSARSLRNDFGVELDFVRIAVLPHQIIEMNLPTRPTKESTHSRGWEGDSVEIDAIPTRILQQLVRDTIVSYIEPHAWRQMQAAEAMERETLESVVAHLRGVA